MPLNAIVRSTTSLSTQGQQTGGKKSLADLLPTRSSWPGRQDTAAQVPSPGGVRAGQAWAQWPQGDLVKSLHCFEPHLVSKVVLIYQLDWGVLWWSQGDHVELGAGSG